jgi:hypothetical protein
VAQLAARYEGHCDHGFDEGTLNEGDVAGAKQQQGGEVEGGMVIKTSTSMPLVSNRAAGSAPAAVRQQVRLIFF